MGTETETTIALRPCTAEDEAELRRIHDLPEVAIWWGPASDDFIVPEPDTTMLTIEVGGAVRGYLEFHEETAPRYRHAAIDIYVDPAVRGRGIGAEAVRLAVCHLIDDRGHHRITIDPAVDNKAAIRAYEKVGFEPVGVLRAYELAPDGERWLDGLLMQVLAGEERREPIVGPREP
jgi:aminoglycoside 6'-N-acetyltransferase